MYITEEQRLKSVSAANLQVLAEAVKSRQFPQLKVLDLGCNNMSNCAKYLLGDPGVTFPCLEDRGLKCTDLTPADLEVLAEAMRCGRLPQLKKLDLCHVSNLRYLLGNPELIFTHLEDLQADLRANPLMWLATYVNTPIYCSVFLFLHARVASCSGSCVNGALGPSSHCSELPGPGRCCELGFSKIKASVSLFPTHWS